MTMTVRPGPGGVPPYRVLHTTSGWQFRGWRVWLALLLLLIAAPAAYVWFVQRVDVGPDEILVLVRKFGATLPAEGILADQVILSPELLASVGESADSTRYRGVILEARTQGWHFLDPFLWGRYKQPITQIEPNEVGILVRKYGLPLPVGKTVATLPTERGPLVEVLPPGSRAAINRFAYDVLRVPPVVIPAGSVGIQTLLVGERPKDPNRYVVDNGEMGVQAATLPAGTYYNNPFVRRIDVLDIRSHTIDLHDDGAIRFPSNDSFDILIDCTVEYAIREDRAAYVLAAIGEHEDIREKIVLPYVRSLCRIEGSKLHARDFIAGDTRLAFQNRVFEGLRQECGRQGIEIRSTLIRQIIPPASIQAPISARQLAGQQIRTYESEMKLAEAEAQFVQEQEMQKQNQAIGKANREVVSVITEAQQNREVALIEARRRLEVATLQLEAARQEAQAIESRGEAEADVLALTYRAQAEPLRSAVVAFGDGETFAQYHFLQRLAPAMKSIMGTTDGPLGEVLRSMTKIGSSGVPSRPPTGSKSSELSSVEGAAQIGGDR